MKDTIHSIREKAHSRGVTAGNVAAVLLVTLAVVSGVAAAQAQQEETFTDDFEDETLGQVPEDWSSDNPTAEVVSEGSVGSQSVYVETSPEGPEGQPLTWTDGPFLDMDEEFEITAVFRHNRAGGSSSTANTRFGVVDDLQDPDVNALLVFNSPNDVAVLSSNHVVDTSDVEDSDANVIPDAFDNEWVRIRMQSDGEGTLRAKVWRVGEDEPGDWMAEESFEGSAGEFGIDPGTETQTREAWLDQITITGYEAIDPSLELDHTNLILHGESSEYQVTYTRFNETTQRNETIDVTDEATVESQNTSVVTVDEAAHELRATSDESVAARANIRAEYNGSVNYNYVTVAEVSMENLEVLPPVYRIGAFLGDWTVFLLLLTAGAGIIGTRQASAFMGLSMAEFVIVIGWFGGYISTGLAMTSVFAALFIGLNLAANIDYSVRR